eukprot:9491934-Pyramimonas_sp.AAC.1
MTRGFGYVHPWGLLSTFSGPLQDGRGAPQRGSKRAPDTCNGRLWGALVTLLGPSKVAWEGPKGLQRRAKARRRPPKMRNGRCAAHLWGSRGTLLRPPLGPERIGPQGRPVSPWTSGPPRAKVPTSIPGLRWVGWPHRQKTDVT